MAVIILNATLTGSFQPSTFVMLAANKLTLDFDIVVPAGPAATIQWYLEFASAPAGPWRREIAEEDSAGGVVLMPEVVRTFAVNAGTQLPTGSYALSAQFVRQEALARIQMRVTAGAASVAVTCPSGTQPSSP